MNKYQKILTVLALIVFSAIIALHYIPVGGMVATGSFVAYSRHPVPIVRPRTAIENVEVPVFTLAVFYAGCMAFAWKKRPQ